MEAGHYFVLDGRGNTFAVEASFAPTGDLLCQILAGSGERDFVRRILAGGYEGGRL